MITEALLFVALTSPVMSGTTPADPVVPDIHCESAGMRQGKKRVTLNFKLSRNVNVAEGEEVIVRWTPPVGAGCPESDRSPAHQRNSDNDSFRTWHPNWMDRGIQKGLLCQGLWRAEIILYYRVPLLVHDQEVTLATLSVYVH